MPSSTTTSGIVSHMTVTVTQRPEPHILYEHCVRPSGIRNAAYVTQPRPVTEDKSVQTSVEQSSGEDGVQGNEDVHTDLSSPRATSQASTAEALTTRSESRESLNTWPRAATRQDAVHLHRLLLPNETAFAAAAAAAAAAATACRSLTDVRMRVTPSPPVLRLTPSDDAVTAASVDTETAQQQQQQILQQQQQQQQQHQQQLMPLVDWSSAGAAHDRGARRVRLRRSVQHLSSLVLYGALVLVFSILLQWNFILRHCRSGRYDANSRTMYL